MVDLRLIESEVERRELKSLFSGALVSTLSEDFIGVVLDVCTVETLDHVAGVMRNNKLRVLCKDGVELFDWKSCYEILPTSRKILCEEKYLRQHSKKTKL